GTKPADAAGLRIGKHGDLKARPSDERKARDSHHLTQFLLVEYLRERKFRKPFPKLSKSAESKLGITRKQGLIDEIDLNPYSKFNLYDLDPTHANDADHRGDGMPALMLARETHMRGGLHVKGEVEEGDEGGKSSQGITVDNKFQAALKGSPLESDKSKDWN